MEKENLNARELSERIGVQASSVSHILTGRNKPSIDFLEKVLESFPDIDLKYLITGKKHLVVNKEIHKSVPETPAKIELSESGLRKEIETEVTNVTKNNEVVEIVKIYKNGTFEIFSQKSVEKTQH